MMFILLLTLGLGAQTINSRTHHVKEDLDFHFDEEYNHARPSDRYRPGYDDEVEECEPHEDCYDRSKPSSRRPYDRERSQGDRSDRVKTPSRRYNERQRDRQADRYLPRVNNERYDGPPRREYDDSAHDRLSLPSDHYNNDGNVPQDILAFRRQFEKLAKKYMKEEHYRPSQTGNRDGRLFDGLIGGIGGLANTLALPFAVTQATIANTAMAFNNFILGGVTQVRDFVADQSTGALIAAGNLPSDVSLAGVEPCSHGSGVCEDPFTCIRNGGEPIGSCANCIDCNICCKYTYENVSSSSGKAIIYYQSPDFPKLRSGAFSSSITIEIRDDVWQVLVEFVKFELPCDNKGCRSDYCEIINPGMNQGVLGRGNSRFCGNNDDQHFYMPVRPKDLLIIKCMMSDEHPEDFRFKFKITQIIDRSAFKRFAVTGGFLLGSALETNPVIAGVLEKNNMVASAFNLDLLPAADVLVLMASIQAEVPLYYQQLKAPEGCTQYFLDDSGTFKSVNFDGKSLFPANLDYSICIRHPDNQVDLTLTAVTFDIPASNPHCQSGKMSVADKDLCCTLNPTRVSDRSGEYSTTSAHKYKDDEHGEYEVGAKYQEEGKYQEEYKHRVISGSKYKDEEHGEYGADDKHQGRYKRGVLDRSGEYSTTGSKYKDEEHGEYEADYKYQEKIHYKQNEVRQFEKYLGVDGTSDGISIFDQIQENQKRYFFCGSNLGRTNYVISERKGPLRIQVFSDGYHLYKNKGSGVGFKIRYKLSNHDQASYNY